ncbi:MAG: WD40 repeat domain-containing protein [Pseudonocardiales bacterium]
MRTRPSGCGTSPTRRVPYSSGNPFKPANHYVYSAVFSPDGRLLAVSSGDSTVRLFDITDPAQPQPVGEPLTGPTNYVYSVSFTTDGTTLAAAATDNTIWLWDLHQRDKATPIATLTAPTGSVYTVDFQPGHDVLVAGGASETAWLWHTDPEQAAAYICATIGDPITEQEWARYVPGRSYQPPCPTR